MVCAAAAQLKTAANGYQHRRQPNDRTAKASIQTKNSNTSTKRRRHNRKIAHQLTECSTSAVAVVRKEAMQHQAAHTPRNIEDRQTKECERQTEDLIKGRKEPYNKHKKEKKTDHSAEILEL